MKHIITSLALFIASTSYAWNGNGHQVIADIAYQHLTPTTKIAVDKLTKVKNHHYPGRSRFRYIATYPDVIRARGNNKFNSWHYIDIPIVAEPTEPGIPQHQNAVWAIHLAREMLKNPRSSDKSKRLFLKFLVHCVGDVHQPLHAATRYSHKHPQGDYGGNRFRIHSAFATNLHTYWDNGGGFLYNRARKVHAQATAEVLSRKVEQAYPEYRFSEQQIQADPMIWAFESNLLAEKNVYTLQEYSEPSPSYQRSCEDIAKYQLALAGYRLANELNRIFDHGYAASHHPHRRSGQNWGVNRAIVGAQRAISSHFN